MASSAITLALCLLVLGASADRLDHTNPEALLAAGRKLMQANRELLAHPTIINGADAVQGRYPWFVSVRSFKGADLTDQGTGQTPDDAEPPHVCGGMMLATTNTFYKYVLTAAHCIFNKAGTAKNLPAPMVLIGPYKRDWSDQNWAQVTVRTSYGTFCNQYNAGTKDNDVCIIVLNTQVVPSATGACGNCVKLWPSTTPLTDNYASTAIGMGYIDDVESLPVNLKEVDLRTQNKDTCNLAVAKYYATKAGKLLIKLQTYFGTKVATVVTDNMICATNPGPTPLPNVNLPLKDTCQGDSGGPLFSKGLTAADDRVFGVTSWGPGCGIRAGVYVKLPNYNTWVQNQVTTLNSTIFEYAVRFTINSLATKQPFTGTLSIDQQFKAGQYVSKWLGKKDQTGAENNWNADFYYLRTGVLRVGYSSAKAWAAQIAKWDVILGGAASTTPQACNNVRTDAANVYLSLVGIYSDLTGSPANYITKIELTGGFGATKLSNVYNVANPVCADL